MKAPLFWLREYCDPPLHTAGIEERLTMTGTKVEVVHRHGVGATEAFVVGRVLRAERHPDADRLSVCSVDVGVGDPQQIVCGAPNVAAGQTVAVARPGAVMPDGTKLGVAKLRGVESNGMILAEDELGIGTAHAGIMVLDDGIAPGTPLEQVLPIAGDVLELEITPNRPDCLGMYGVARELHAATGAPLAAPPWESDPVGLEPGVPGAGVTIQAPDLCPRFTLRGFEGVTISESPPWLKARLMAAGQRPISNVVDITNYVMLVTGQPLHAFDWDLVAGSHLTVRRAADGERMTTLDDVERELDYETVIICDEDGPTSIAGIMGGQRSEVGDGTTRVLMEAATWIGPNIHRSSGRLTLRSEASARFEKQLSPELTMEAQALAAQLMIELCGARPVGGTIDAGGVGEAPAPILLREARVESLLGERIPTARCAEILESLGFGTGPADAGLEVTVPHWRRRDVHREADVVEEVGRIDGFERLPATLPSRRGAAGRLTREQLLRRRAEDALTGAGAHEVVGWSFAAPGVADRLRLAPEDPRRSFVVLENPMSEEHAVMRTMLLGSLLDAAGHNVHRGQGDLALWEAGAVYRTVDPPAPSGLPDERRHLGGLLLGSVRPSTWREERPPRADLFAAKGLLGAPLAALRVAWEVEPAEEPFLHPGRSAAVLVGAERIGWVGEIHPLVAAAWDVEGAVGFEVDLDSVIAAAPGIVRYQDLTSFPEVRQDLAVVVAAEVPAARVMKTIEHAGGPTLARVEVFDVYRGEGIGADQVSLALHLAFRASDRTLTDEEVAEVRAGIVAALERELGASLR